MKNILKVTGNLLKIHISTAFYWSHKILNALGSLGVHQLQGIVESDETFFREYDRNGSVIARKAGTGRVRAEVQHVNNFHNRLKKWMVRFQVEATKYLDNYLYWFRWLDLGKKLAFENRVEQMLVSSCQKSNNITVEILRSA